MKMMLTLTRSRPFFVSRWYDNEWKWSEAMSYLG